MTTAPRPEVPEDLVRAIGAGQCVAFVGAGFSAATVPSWARLLEDVASQAPAAARDHCLRLLGKRARTALDYEAAAQALRAGLGEEQFVEALKTRLAEPPRNEKIEDRLRWLRGIPFRAVLTTNFDGLLSGVTPGRDAYLSVLRAQDHRWWDGRYWDGLRPGPQVVKLHGDLSTRPPAHLVIARRDYRRRLYGNPAYQTFLRAVFSTTTVLYIGFSFTDAYLNELRSEILSLLDHRGTDAPIAYALVNDVAPEEADYFLAHEGIRILSYETEGKDYSGFDRWLEALHEATNPGRRLGRLLSGRRLLWVDSHPQNNHYGMQFLKEAAQGAENPCQIDQPLTWEEGVERLRASGADLVLTHWGHANATDKAGQPCSVAEQLLVEMRAQDLRAPVIVFASGGHAEENRRTALNLGAQAYTFEWPELFRELERVFRPLDDAREPHRPATGE